MPLPTAGRTWKFVKWLLRLGPSLPESARFVESLFTDDAEHADPRWIRWHIIWNRATPVGTIEDQAQVKFDIVNITGGDVDGSWTGADFASVKTEMDAWLTAIGGIIPNTHQAVYHKAYGMGFNPSDPGPGIGPKSSSRPFLPTGPPAYQVAISLTGGGVGGLPYQCAASVTLKTPWPGHWGRIYVPFGGTMGTNGRFGAGTMGTLANATHALITRLADKDFLVHVPVGQVNKNAFHALLGVTDVQVDDIPDVIRRRRPRAPAFRTLGTG